MVVFMISVENLTKRFGDQLLFEGVSFNLNLRERIGLVGRNGHGKTTLFRIIIGDEAYDEGNIIVPKHYRIGHVRQDIEFERNTVLEEGMRGLPQQERDHFWKVEKILAGLGFSGSDMDRHPGEFSGGFQVRLNLAKVLVSEPDLLLLDEPTNYLDITAIRWIERFLNAWPHEVILITHDRSFMDKVVTHIIGIHRKKLRKVRGDTEKYYSQIAQDEEIYEKTRINDERRRKEIEQFINRFRAKARLANLVQSRVKLLAKMKKHQKLEQIKALDFSFRSLPLPTRHALSARDISFSYDQRHPVIENFNLTINKEDRICVIGKNGRGKTTLLKLLAGTLQPQQGQITYNPNVTMGIYEQTNIKSLLDERTVEEEILYSSPGLDKQAARNICAAMLFSGDEALKKISVLSGGEKSRVMLGKILVTPLNLLILDEPTNHLDMESCDALLAALDSFVGTVILVTHNEMFLHALAQRLIIFQNDHLEVFEGGYQRFLDKGGWQEDRQANGDLQPAAPQTNRSTNPTKKALRRQRSAIIAERSRILRPLQKQVTAVENEIEKKEAELSRLNQSMQQATQTQNGARIAEISRAIHSCQQTIDHLFDQLDDLTRKVENHSTEFENRLEQLDVENP